MVSSFTRPLFATFCIKPRHIYSLNQLRFSNTIRDEVLEHHRKSKLSHTKETEDPPLKFESPRLYEYVVPEFLPNPIPHFRDRIAEKLEHMDMVRRRSVINIPEFYVGSIMAVTVADAHAAGKKNRFVGICIERDLPGLRSTFTLRNVIDSQGIEVCYKIYSPTILKIEVLRLEKRLDEHLRYLRDAPHEYSTVPFDLDAIAHPPGTAVPVNDIKVKMKPYPWTTRWELHYFKGVDTSESGIWEKRIKRAEHPQNKKEWNKYDLMKWYRETVPDKREIMDKVYNNLQELKESKSFKKVE